jgi:NitT/TauT family transport system substrate-binding protein
VVFVLRKKPVALMLAVALSGTLTGCGALGGSSPDAAANGQVERSTIRVGQLALIDAVPLHIAIDKGYFRDEGLAIDLSTVGKGSESVDKLNAGELDVGLTSYPNAITPQAKGIATLKVVADAAQTTPDFALAVVKRNGPITDAKQLVGKKIAISSTRGISELVMTDQLITMGMAPGSVAFLSMPITDMPAALGRGDIAAAVISQPALELAKRQGATKLLDPFTGPDADFPWSGWLATARFVHDNPQTVDAFRRALGKAVADTADRKLVEDQAHRHLGVDKAIAPLMRCRLSRALKTPSGCSGWRI